MAKHDKNKEQKATTAPAPDVKNLIQVLANTCEVEASNKNKKQN